MTVSIVGMSSSLNAFLYAMLIFWGRYQIFQICHILKALLAKCMYSVSKWSCEILNQNLSLFTMWFENDVGAADLCGWFHYLEVNVV
jgi:hypothetical protein